MFFVCVRTTGIYCRPGCRARLPKPSSCAFVSTAAEAEAAGFRPCLLCRPELAPAHAGAGDRALEHALFSHLQSAAVNGGPLAGVAKRAGYSERQLRRRLLKSHGVTPSRVVQTQRLLFARKLLRETRLPVIDVAMSAGFGSLRRFNALFRSQYGLTPSAARRPSPAAKEETLTLRLAYREPFAWQAMLQYLAARAVPGVELIDLAAGTYTRTAEGLQVCLEPGGTYLQVRLPAAISSSAYSILERVRRLFDLDADPVHIGAHLAADPFLKPAVESSPGLRVPGAWDAFELALRAVLGQQISVAGATTLSARLAACFGFKPDILADARAEEIAAIGLPAARARTVRALAEAARDGALEIAPGTPPDTAIEALRAIPGIGDWTAQYIAMRAWGFPDAFPASDLGLRKAASTLAGSPVDAARLLKIAEPWRPWRAYAAQYLWKSLK
jgi:AraC family transcriptional regulator of adaptative response / DNA-3-methyladenine glycosylase II